MDQTVIKAAINTIPDFPKPGVQFRDITGLFEDPKAARMVTDALSQRYIDKQLTHISAIDARGFLLGATLAYSLNLPLILFRKPGKLPGPVDSLDYVKEYGSDTLTVHQNSFDKNSRTVIVDDLIATGETVLAACKLARSQGAEVVEVASIIDLPELGGTQKLHSANIEVFHLVTYDEDE